MTYKFIADDMTIEQNYKDLKAHQDEFNKR